MKAKLFLILSILVFINCSSQTIPEPDAVFLVSIPANEVEFQNIFHRQPQLGEMDNINKKISEFQEIENVIFVRSIKDIEVILNKYSGKVIFTLIGHNDNGIFSLANNESMHLRDFVKKLDTKTGIILSCNAKSFVGQLIPAVNEEITFSEAIQMAKVIEREAPGCKALLSSTTEVTEKLASILNKKKAGGIQKQFIVAGGLLGGTVIVLKSVDSKGQEGRQSKDSLQIPKSTNDNKDLTPIPMETAYFFSRNLIDKAALVLSFNNFIHIYPSISNTVCFFPLGPNLDSIANSTLALDLYIQPISQINSQIEPFFRRHQNKVSLSAFKNDFPAFFSELLKITFDVSFHKTTDFESTFASYNCISGEFSLDTLETDAFMKKQEPVLFYNASKNTIRYRIENLLPEASFEQKDFNICNAMRCLVILQHLENRHDLPFDINLGELTLRSLENSKDARVLSLNISQNDIIESKCEAHLKRWLFTSEKIKCDGSGK